MVFRYNNLKKLALMCIQDGGMLQETKAGITYCSLLPLEDEEFPCPYSGELIDVGERFERYRCFYQKKEIRIALTPFRKYLTPFILPPLENSKDPAAGPSPSGRLTQLQGGE